MATAKRLTRVAVVSDVHCSKQSQGLLQPLFAQMNASADVIAICGDLTDYGLPEEAHILVKELAGVKVPVVAILGNHDHESGKQDEVAQVLSDAGVNMLDGSAIELEGVGFAGTKGFGGGFGARTLALWGETTIKAFVREALDEAMKLETALARLSTEHRVALLHYSPIRATVEGEPPELFPFLGTSRLEEPFTLHPVTSVFHGHAHHGSPAGQTAQGIPVYNVSLPVLRAHFPDRPPFHLLELSQTEPAKDERMFAQDDAGARPPSK